MFSAILERFIKDSSVAVIVRALLENLLNADKLDRWFEGVRQTQYTSLFKVARSSSRPLLSQMLL